MKRIQCEMCGSNEMVKQNGMYVCQMCGTQYTLEEAQKLMVEGTVKIDNSAFVEKYLTNARRALAKDDWEEVEKYYNMVEQNTENNIEAVFFSSYGKTMLSFTDSDYFKREQKFHVLNKSISVINDYFELTNEDKETVLRQISDAIARMSTTSYVYNKNAYSSAGGNDWMKNLIRSVRAAFFTELQQIKAVHPDLGYIDQLLLANAAQSSSGCYVATAVYGSYDCPQVWTLRRYRDYTLSRTWYGRVFIRTYYAISPTLVKWFGETRWFKKLWRGKLDHMVASLQEKGYESTPYEDRMWK